MLPLFAIELQTVTLRVPLAASLHAGPMQFGLEWATLSGHKMEMWELDHFRSWDDKVGWNRFPTLTAPTSGTNCDIYGYDGGGWGSYRSKSSGTANISTRAALRVVGAEFVAENGVCCDPLENPSCVD